MPREKRILIIAGPNGAGKTTFANQFLLREAGVSTFVNADLIASGLNPNNPESEAVQAGRVMLGTIRDLVARGASFTFETTLSGLAFSRAIPRWQDEGYRVELYYLSLSSPDLAIERVNIRVEGGGHFVQGDVIRRRFDAGLRNLRQVYSQLVDQWKLYDNSGPFPVLLEEGGR